MLKQRKDMARMEDWSKEMEEFKEVVPDAMNFERWLVERQKIWSDGTTFGCRDVDKLLKNHSKLIVGIVVCSNFLQSISWVLGVVKSSLYIRWNNLKRKLA